MVQKRNMVIALLAGLTLLALPSCIHVEYQGANADGLMPNEAALSLELQLEDSWPAGHDQQGYKVLMSRKVNTIHYMWDVGQDGSFGDDEKKKIILNGDYYAIAFNEESSIFEYQGLENFVEDRSASMKNLYAAVSHLDDEDIKAIEDKKILEYNAYSPIINSADSPLFLGINKNAHMVHAQENVLSLQLRNMIMSLTFFVDIITGEGVSIDNVSASLSGVCDRVQLMSGLVSDLNTYRVLLDMNNKMSLEGKEIYEGTANILGLFPSDDQSRITGPGILHLTIRASVTEDGSKTEKMFNAGINLRSILLEEKFMLESEDKSGYTIAENDVAINIPTVLRIDADQILSEGGEGSPVWICNEIILDMEL